MTAASQTVTLTGAALAGVEPGLTPFAALPERVRLGRRRPAARAAVPRFGHYFDPKAAKPPASTNRRETCAASLARMYLNDRLGCCVISGKAHALGLWSGADANPGGVVLATDQEIQQQYRSICGPGDQGCYITQVLDVMRSKGFKAGGRLYKLDGYVACDHTDKLEVQVVQYLFGATTVGINLPEAWTQEAVWDVTDTQIVGGHDVTPIDYDEQGVYVSSWGRVYLITWAAFTSPKWVDEYYALLAPLWYGDDRLAPSGVRVDELKADLAKLAAGEIPPVPGPPEPEPAEGKPYLLATDESGVITLTPQ